MAIISNLYPPLVYDTLPSFIRTKTCRIYFSLSNYNSATDIKNVQISLINQKTNQSAFNSTNYPSGIKIASMIYDSTVQDNYNYYIEIPVSDLTEGVFGLNEFYKVQLRFTSTSAPNPPSTGKGLATWLYDNMRFFSEWSKVCLIKGIEQPIVTIRGFDDTNENQETILTNSIIDLIGQLYYANNVQEKEYLKSYNVKLYQNNNFDNIIFDSGEIYTNQYNPNEINCELGYDLLDSINYTLSFTYTTNNLYTETKNYNFTVIEQGVDKLNATITATPDEENGRVKIDIVTTDHQKFIGNLTIRRTSSKSNFHKWEDIKTITYKTGEELNYSWYDITIESGVWYKYCAQRRNARGDRGVIIQIDNPIMCVLDDIYLTKNDCQLKIKFNPSLNEFKYNVTESQQVTIGSQYPYIKRNGNNYFRSFPIGGLISSFIDTTDWYDPHFYNGEFHYDQDEIRAFTSKDEIYGDSKKLYNEYNNNHNITQYNDYIYEREFRKKVYDFLYKHDVKLFRSTTEGNILIKLMNIDFQPVESLGRMLYSFTATAIEVDEANIKNYQKYGIQNVGEYQSYVTYEHEVLGQIQGIYDADDGNILTNVIAQKYASQANTGFINEVNSLKWLKLEIDSDPYLIIEESNGHLVKATTESDIDVTKATVGYIVEINGVEIVVHPKIIRRTENAVDGTGPITTTYIGYLELKEPNTQISSLKFKYPTSVSFNYIANLKEIEDTSKLASRLYYIQKLGQLYGTFEPKDSLLRKIYNKYLLKYKKYYQRLLDITQIQVQGDPGTVIYVQDSLDSAPNRHVLQNGYLQLKQDDIFIEGLYFCGRHLTECTDPLQISTVNGITEFTPQEGVYDKISDIQNPINGGLYQIKTYGIKSELTFENHRILLVTDDLTEKIEVTPDNLYTLLLDTIENDETLQFVYYYGCWYILNKALEKTKLLKGDLRHIRDDEYIETNERYDDFSEIKNPILNGVYWISSYVITNPIQYNRYTDSLTVEEENVIEKADKNYALLLERLYEKSISRYIYYHNKWYSFTSDNDVLCPVDGIVNYCCEIVKGEY